MSCWGMVIDLRKCIGCLTCQSVCWEINNAPPGVFWRRVVDREIRDTSELQRIFLPMNCMHCSDPSCLEVCPTGATYQRGDGIVDIKQELCIGCGACVVACPYHARTISKLDTIGANSGIAPQDVIEDNSDRIGICTKCNFCIQRVDEGLANGLRPGSDFEATPICVNSCIANALYFGDLEDPESKVSGLIRENKTVRLQEKLGTRPAVYYIVE